jgi:hypothetical protein
LRVKSKTPITRPERVFLRLLQKSQLFSNHRYLVYQALAYQNSSSILDISRKEFAMPMELLQKISRRALPLTITDIESIDKLRVLRASGHVAVFLPRMNGKKPFARVLAITEIGREALRNLEAQNS